MERSQWEIILYVLFAFIMYDLQMNALWDGVVTELLMGFWL